MNPTLPLASIRCQRLLPTSRTSLGWLATLRVSRSSRAREEKPLGRLDSSGGQPATVKSRIVLLLKELLHEPKLLLGTNSHSSQTLVGTRRLHGKQPDTVRE